MFEFVCLNLIEFAPHEFLFKKKREMSTSRAYFLKQLGLTSYDIQDPSCRPSRDRPIREDTHAPLNAQRNLDSNRATPSDARAEFLKSLGIEQHLLANPDKVGRVDTKENVEQPSKAPGTSFAAAKAFVQHRIQKDDDDGEFPPAVKSLKGLKPSPHVEDIPADASAEDIKCIGNQAFEVGDFRKAVRMYSRAIDKDPRNSALYSNRSAAYLQGGKQMGLDTRSMALRDAEKAIELKPSWFKGYSRRGDALFKLERWGEAIEAYENALRLDPANTSVQFSLRECQQMVPVSKTTTEAMAWSQPKTKVHDHRSAPYSLDAASRKSASDLVNEMQRDVEQSNSGILMGRDYRDEELARFRTRASGTSSSSVSVETSFRQTEYEKVTKSQLDRTSISQEFGSDAAAAYQRSLLDAYRKRKATK